MQYTCEITIDLPRERVIKLFDNPDNLARWQEGLKSIKLTEGKAGTAGAVSKRTYNFPGRKPLEMTETILEHNLPEKLSALYETKGVKNWVHYSFHACEKNRTRWVMDTRFQYSFFLGLLSVFMKRSFMKQTLKDMNCFRYFAEEQG